MDTRFHALMQAALQGRLADFERILDDRPELVNSRSSRSHPTLLQFVVLEGGTGTIAGAEPFARTLIDRGAVLDEPLVAAASVGARTMVDLLLEGGASIEACAPWTPLEEAVYWAHDGLKSVLRARGARVLSLRCAAGLDSIEETDRFLGSDGPLPEAGPVRFPWGAASDQPQDVLDQALVIAAKNGATTTATLLLSAGADVHSTPPGIHEGGGPLHLAAMYGRADVVSVLLDAGADPSAADPKHNSTPAGWARYAGFEELAAHLDGRAGD